MTQAGLRIAEKQPGSILESIGDSFIALDRQARITYVNENGARMTGMRRTELIGACVWELFPHAATSKFHQEYRRALDSGTSVHFEEFYPDPLNLWVECHGYPSSEGVSVFFRDITQRKQAEEILRDERAKLKAIVENLNVGILIADTEGALLSMNSAALKMLGFASADDMYTRHEQFERGFEMRYLDGRLVPPEERPYRRSLDGDFFNGLEMQTIDVHTGHQFIGSWSVSPVHNSRDDVYLLILSVQDITQRKQADAALRESEGRLRIFIEHAPVSLAMFDRDMRYLSVSRRYLTENNLNDKDLVGRSCYEVFAEIPEVWKASHHRALAGEVVHSDSDRLERTDGSVHWLRWEVRPWCDQAGNIAGIVIFSEDITERKEAEEALRQLNETLEQQVAERTALAETRAKQLQKLAVELIEAEERERRRVAELLHDDLQQILAAAKMQLQAACKKLPPNAILSNVAELLEASIGKSRRLSHELSPPELFHAGLMASLQWLLGQMEAQFGLEVMMDVTDEQPFENAALKVFIVRGVQELLFNIVKHAGVKRASVALSDAGDKFVLTVSDHGRGFDPEILSAERTSTGLGLLSLRERARHIGGSLAIDSAPGSGSRFTLMVPRNLSTRR